MCQRHISSPVWLCWGGDRKCHQPGAARIVELFLGRLSYTTKDGQIDFWNKHQSFGILPHKIKENSTLFSTCKSRWENFMEFHCRIDKGRSTRSRCRRSPADNERPRPSRLSYDAPTCGGAGCYADQLICCHGQPDSKGLQRALRMSWYWCHPPQRSITHTHTPPPEHSSLSSSDLGYGLLVHVSVLYPGYGLLVIGLSILLKATAVLLHAASLPQEMRTQVAGCRIMIDQS